MRRKRGESKWEREVDRVRERERKVVIERESTRVEVRM